MAARQMNGQLPPTPPHHGAPPGAPRPSQPMLPPGFQPGLQQRPGQAGFPGDAFTMRSRGVTGVRDISENRPITEKSCRQALTEYVVYTLQRDNTIRDGSTKSKSNSWVRVNCFKEAWSKSEILDRLKTLQSKKKTLSEKLKTLEGKQGQHIAKMIEDLHIEEPDQSFEFTLEQIDLKVTRHKKETSRGLFSSGSTSKSSGKARDIEAITLFVKRAPKEYVNCMRLKEEKDRLYSGIPGPQQAHMRPEPSRPMPSDIPFDRPAGLGPGPRPGFAQGPPPGAGQQQVPRPQGPPPGPGPQQPPKGQGPPMSASQQIPRPPDPRAAGAKGLADHGVVQLPRQNSRREKSRDRGGKKQKKSREMDRRSNSSDSSTEDSRSDSDSDQSSSATSRSSVSSRGYKAKSRRPPPPPPPPPQPIRQLPREGHPPGQYFGPAPGGIPHYSPPHVGPPMREQGYVPEQQPIYPPMYPQQQEYEAEFVPAQRMHPSYMEGTRAVHGGAISGIRGGVNSYDNFVVSRSARPQQIQVETRYARAAPRARVPMGTRPLLGQFRQMSFQEQQQRGFPDLNVYDDEGQFDDFEDDFDLQNSLRFQNEPPPMMASVPPPYRRGDFSREAQMARMNIGPLPRRSTTYN